MATLAGIYVTISKASPVFEQSTFTTYQYHIRVQLGATSWEVVKRFSEFDTLLQGLGTGRYSGLPKLPAKTLLGSPTDQASIDERKELLRIIVQDLVQRPDTRASALLQKFLKVEEHVPDAAQNLVPEAVRSFEDPRFGVSGLCVAPDANLILVAHEDSTHLSRLGRVWSVVEPDELGAVHLWTRASETTWKRTFSTTYGIKVRSLCWEGTTRQFFVGLENGKIEVFAVAPGAAKPGSKDTLELHHSSPVTHLSCSHRRLLSLGLDAAMRVIDVRTRELLCGGRLAKRLRSDMDYLSSGYLDDAQDRVFIGSSGGDIFIYDVSRNPPNFLYGVELPSKPVSAIHMCQEILLAAHGDCISVLCREGTREDQRWVRKGSHRAKYLQNDEATVLSLATAPERQLVFGGYSDGSVAIWSMSESEALLVFKAHPNDTTQLVWLESAPWGPALLTGGGDGKVTTWRLLGKTEEYLLCPPPGAVHQDLSLPSAPSPKDESLSVFEPDFRGGGADPFRSGLRINPQALKSDEDSDSDNDLVSAFR